MTWSSIAAVDDAIDTTRAFLFPVSLRRWSKLAVLVVLMGFGASFSASVPPVPGDLDAVDWGAVTVPITEETLVAIAVGLAVLALALGVVGVVSRLVFYDALRTDTVRIWSPFRRRFRQGLGLFAFYLLLGVAIAGPIVAGVWVWMERGVSLETGAIVGLGAAYLLFFGVVLLVGRFTNEFVVPVMVLRDEGVLDGWRRFLPTLRRSWKEFLLYLFVHFVLAVGISVAEGIAFLFVGGSIVVLAALLALIVAGLLGGLSALTGTTAGLVALGVIGVVALIALVVVLLPIRVLTLTYLVSYELWVLGGVDPELLVFPESLRIDPELYDGASNA